MIPCARESADVPYGDYLWRADNGSVTAYERAKFPCADDVLFCHLLCDLGEYDLMMCRCSVRIGWSAEVDGDDSAWLAVLQPGSGWWMECSRDTLGAVECWFVGHKQRTRSEEGT